MLDAVSASLRNLPKVKLPRLPRMADFAVWVTACEPALGWEPDSFLRAYDSNLKDANELALESSPLVTPIRQLVEEKETWTGTAGELLEELGKRTTEETKKARDWPKRANTLSGQLRRIAPNLRQVGINVEFDRDKHRRYVKLCQTSSPSSSSSSASESPSKNGFAGDDG